MKRAACTTAWHRLICSSPTTFDRETGPAIGYLDDEAARFKLANCRSCNSTLALPVAGAGLGR